MSVHRIHSLSNDTFVPPGVDGRPLRSPYNHHKLQTATKSTVVDRIRTKEEREKADKKHKKEKKHRKHKSRHFMPPEGSGCNCQNK